MTFLDRDNSDYAGEPVTLYEFRRGGLRLYYADADRDVQAGEVTYLATPISHNGINQKGSPITDLFEVTASYDLEIGSWYRFTPPSDLVYLVVRRFHYGEPESVVMWIGTVVSVSTEEIGKITVRCQAVSVSLKRGGLRLAWQRGCPHALYDQNCRADKSLFAFETNVVSINSAYVSVYPPLPNGPWWPGGFLEWSLGSGTFERRLIESLPGAGGSDGTLSGGLGGGNVKPFGNRDGYTVGMAITAYPGCLRTSDHCDTFFANLDNYGGFDFLPNRTPFDGNPIF